VTEPPASRTSCEKAMGERKARQAANNPKLKYAADQRPIGSSIMPAGPEDAWTKLAHALFQTNEAMFLN
jgi:hypothetical protein